MHFTKLTDNFRKLPNFKNETELFNLVDQNLESDDFKN